MWGRSSFLGQIHPEEQRQVENTAGTWRRSSSEIFRRLTSPDGGGDAFSAAAAAAHPRGGLCARSLAALDLLSGDNDDPLLGLAGTQFAKGCKFSFESCDSGRCSQLL